MPSPDSAAFRLTQPALSLAVQYASTASNLPVRAQIRRWILAALEHSADITLRIVDAEEAQTLNRDYRQKDYATNVLTFEYGEIGRDDTGRAVLGGDIVICAPVVEKEAVEQGKPLRDHYAHLAIHGALHLQGYDHEDEADAVIMEAHETDILKRFRIANPYFR
ncbi:MAG: rRNA maturation RNase YbeY [Thiobacillaceae bacterium]